MGDGPDLTPSDNSEPMRGKMARAGFLVMDQTLMEQMEQTKPQPRQSYLDIGVEDVVSAFGQCVLQETPEESRRHDEVEKYGKMFVKTAPLFLDRKRAVSLTVGIYGADQASPSDGAVTQLADFTLGGTKGLALKGTVAGLGAIKASPAIKGISLGIVNRTVDTGLTRQSWMNPTTGEYSARIGIANTAIAAADPRALVTDAVLFGASEWTMGRLNYATKGAFYRNPALPVVASGGIFGAGSGATEEVMRQKQAGENFDLSKVLFRAGLSAGVNSLAASVGAVDRARQLRLAPPAERAAMHDSKAPVSDRVLRFNELDARQLELGPLTIKQQLNDVAFLAEARTPTGGSKPVIFRLTDTPDMKMRFSNELLDYQMHRAIGFDTKSLAVVGSEAVIGGQRRPGYVQELGGRSFEDALRSMATQQYGISTDRAAARILRNNPDISSQNEQVWIAKMLQLQWDNHGHNKVMHPDRKMSVIDNADLIPAAVYKTDYIPSWGKTASRVSLLEDRLIGQTAGKPISQKSRDLMQDFVKSFDTPAGRTALGGAGHSPAQVDGILGRSRYFAEVGTMPTRDTPNLLVSATLRALYMLKKGQSLRFEQQQQLADEPAK